MINETIGEGPFHIEDRLEGHSHLDAPYRYKVIHLFKYFEQKHFLVHSYAQNFSFRGEPLPLYPGDMEARGKVNIVIFSGQCHSQPSPSPSPSPSPLPSPSPSWSRLLGAGVSTNWVQLQKLTVRCNFFGVLCKC